MTKNKEYYVSWEGSPAIRVKAASFVGAMRAAFGPGDYEVVGALGNGQCQIKWGGSFFLVTLQL